MSSTATASASLISTIFGCLFFSVLFGSALWGAASLQLYYYCEKFWKTDRQYLKVFVVSIWILDTVHQAILMEINYMYFVSGIVNPALLTQLPREVGIVGFIIGIMDAMVQVFFVQRVWKLSNRNRPLTGILSLLVVSQFVLTMTYSGIIVNFTLLEQLPSLHRFEVIMNSSAVFVDIPLALSMIWFLWNGRCGVKRTDSVVNRIVMLTIGSGLVTALWAIIAIVSAAAAPRTLIYISSDLIFPRLYFNCMMASLNARWSYRASLENEVVDMSFGISNLSSVSKEQPSATMGETCPTDLPNVRSVQRAAPNKVSFTSEDPPSRITERSNTTVDPFAKV